MAQQTLTGLRKLGGASARTSATPDLAIRLVGALLALGISTVHVADQGGITALNSPAWIGWGYRTIEVGGVLTAIALLAAFLPWSAWTGWAAGLLLGIGPFVAYLASRSIGVPGDPGDVGNWGYWVGTVSLFMEAALMILCVSMLLAQRRNSRSQDS
jgi:hypothetical protein